MRLLPFVFFFFYLIAEERFSTERVFAYLIKNHQKHMLPKKITSS